MAQYLSLTEQTAMPWLAAVLHLPFDLLRAQHADGMQAGLLTKSILESRDFERQMVALEQLWLGPFARRV